MKIELATFHPDTCSIAERYNIQRIELCEDYAVGGVTPSVEFFNLARTLFSREIFVMARPRGGNFNYSQEEFKVVLESVKQLKSLGADGFVSGFLTEENTINIPQLEKFAEACSPLPFTFHRAFDAIEDWPTALDQLIDVGCERVLTSGRAQTAFEGRERLRDYIAYADDNIIVMPGGGIRSNNFQDIINACHAKEIHTAAVITKFNSAVVVADEEAVRRLVDVKMC